MAAQIICFGIMAFCFYVLVYTLLHRKHRKFYIPAKMACSTMFLITAILMGCLSGHMEKLWGIMPAFLLCFCGDLALGFHNRMVKQKYMLIGTGFFLLAHIGFYIYLLRYQPIQWIDFIFPVCMVLAAIYLCGRDDFDVGKFKPCACGYAFFVGSLASKGVLVMLEIPCMETLLIAIGGIFFLISDLLIMVLFFKKRRPWWTHGWNVGTYFFAMYCLAISIYY